MTSSLIGDVSSHCLGRSSQRVSQVSMGTMVCFLANASISPQPGSGNLGPGEWSEAHQTTWTLLALPSRVFLCWRPRQGANLHPSASKAVLYPVELRGQPRERRSFCSGSEVASGLYQALAPCYIRRFYCEHCRLRAYTVILCLG